MHPSKEEEEDEDLFNGHPPEQIMDFHSQPLILNNHQDDHFSLPPISEMVLFQDEEEEEYGNEAVSQTSSDADDNRSFDVPSSAGNDAVSSPPVHSDANPKKHPHLSSATAYINPEPHISSQFYTFNGESHALMIRCILQSRLATPEEIQAATPQSLLASWRAVWKDRNVDTAYITAWKRIQDKLAVHVDHSTGNKSLCFKNSSSSQFVSHFNQWQDIIMSFHGDTDLKHLGLKETIDKIKQTWTVGAKFYGIPESFIRVCVAACLVCSDESGSGARTKRRRFEYTESFDVPAKEVPIRLQQLATKHKVVLCIRQKYIRYKPFMAEVKDYACHRAGEPTSSKKSKVLKREPYTSKRCGCGFRIRAIVPISNYNEKDKTFVYQEEGMAVFKLYAVHSGHEPGPLDGNARIMHRVVWHKGGLLMDQETVYGMSDEADRESFRYTGRDDGNFQHSVLLQLQEVRNELQILEGRIKKMPKELLGSVLQDLFKVTNRIRNTKEYCSKPVGLQLDEPETNDILVGESELADWNADEHHPQIYRVGKDADLVEEDEDSFGRTLEDVASWDNIRTCHGSGKDLLRETCKPEKWMKCSEFDEKGILDCEDSKLIKPIRHDEIMETDLGLNGIQLDNFYAENPKWYDSSCGLDSSADCGFRHGEIL